jgi:hypothetical protein
MHKKIVATVMKSVILQEYMHRKMIFVPNKQVSCSTQLLGIQFLLLLHIPVNIAPLPLLRLGGNESSLKYEYINLQT